MNTSFFAVIYDTSVTIPGDERSRSHPGHGYPEHTVVTREIKQFPNEKEFRNWIFNEEARTHKRKYQAVKCIPIEVTTKIEIKIGNDEYAELQTNKNASGGVIRCSLCLERQFATPSGMTCKNGHGGAPGIN